MYKTFICAIAGLALASQARASTLYGSTSAGGPGELWIINQNTGAGVTNIGPLNDSNGTNYAVTGMAYDSFNGKLYGSTGNRSGQDLLIIDPNTAQVTVVGGFNAAGGTMSDIAFDPSGNLYGISSNGGANLWSIDINTGLATKIGNSGVSFTAGGGLAISPTDVFFGTPTTNQFGTYNSTTGVYTNITNPVKPAGNTASYASLAFDGSQLYGMDLGSPTHLVKFDSAGNVTDIGASVSSVDGIAFVSSVPEPASAAIILCGATGMMIGRRRK